MAQDSGATVHADYVLSQGNQNHVANTMSSPYYRFDGVNDKIEVADNANLDFATNDFSVEAFVRIPSGVASRTILGKIDHTNAALEGYSMEVGANGKLAGRIVGNNTRTLISEGSTVIADGNFHHVCITFDRNANATVYVNGVAEGTTDISGSSGDASNSNPFQIGTNDQEANFTEMENSHARVFNNLLTATEVKELYSGASVPYKYKGANQTNVITGWTNTSYGVFTSSGANITDAHRTGGTQQAGTGALSLTVGKRYRLTANITVDNGTGPTLHMGAANAAVGTDLTSQQTSAGINTYEFTLTNSSNNYLWVLDADVSEWSGTFELVPIGAVAEYDGSSAGEKVWGDKSGNSLDGTVSGATVENAPYDAGTEYEEGTFTPTVSGGITSVGYATQVGTYVRVGNLVTFQFHVVVNSGSTASANFELATLPYTSRNTTGLQGGAYVVFQDNFDEDGSEQAKFNIEPNTTTIEVFKETGARFLGSNMDSANITLRLVGQYFV
jgi:hypothetical protein